MTHQPYKIPEIPTLQKYDIASLASKERVSLGLRNCGAAPGSKCAYGTRASLNSELAFRLAAATPTGEGRPTAARAGPCDPLAARQVAAEAATVIEMLRRWGVPFDQDAGGELSLTLEAAHWRRRILHAGGDATGAALVRTLAARVRAGGTIELDDLPCDGRTVRELWFRSLSLAGCPFPITIMRRSSKQDRDRCPYSRP